MTTTWKLSILATWVAISATVIMLVNHPPNKCTMGLSTDRFTPVGDLMKYSGEK